MDRELCQQPGVCPRPSYLVVGRVASTSLAPSMTRSDGGYTCIWWWLWIYWPIVVVVVVGILSDCSCGGYTDRLWWWWLWISWRIVVVKTVLSVVPVIVVVVLDILVDIDVG